MAARANVPHKYSLNELQADEVNALNDAISEHATELESYAIAFQQLYATGVLAGKVLCPLTLPQGVVGGYWYLTASGVWEAKSSFNAQAAPAPGAYWLNVASFNGSATVGSAGITDATDAGRAMLTALSAAAQRQLVNNPRIRANAYGQHPAFSVEDGDGGAWAWVLAAINNLSQSVAGLQPPSAAAPIVTGFLPGKGSEGASVTITGSRFVDITSVSFNGTPASFQVVNATTIQAVVPTGATTGPVSVSNASATGTSAADFTVGVATTPPPTGDTTAPNISLTVPTAGATLTVGQPVTLTAQATDNVAVTGVAFSNGATGTPLGSGAKNGNSYTLAYTPTASGSLTISATASDAAGNSQAASVTVNVQAAPVALAVSFTVSSPTATAGQNLSYSGVASGGTGPYSHLVQATNADTGEVLAIGSQQATTYNGIWQAVPAGTYDLTDTVTDAAGGSKISASRRVVISAASTPAGYQATYTDNAPAAAN